VSPVMVRGRGPSFPAKRNSRSGRKAGVRFRAAVARFRGLWGGGSEKRIGPPIRSFGDARIERCFKVARRSGHKTSRLSAGLCRRFCGLSPRRRGDMSLRSNARLVHRVFRKGDAPFRPARPRPVGPHGAIRVPAFPLRDHRAGLRAPHAPRPEGNVERVRRRSPSTDSRGRRSRIAGCAVRDRKHDRPRAAKGSFLPTSV
jgi:hypothetical protein